MKAQNDQVSCPKSHNLLVVETRLDPQILEL